MADRGFQQEAPHQRPLASNVRATVLASTPLVRRARAPGQAGDHRCRGHHPASPGTVRPVYRGPLQRRPGPSSLGVRPRIAQYRELPQPKDVTLLEPGQVPLLGDGSLAETSRSAAAVPSPALQPCSPAGPSPHALAVQRRGVVRWVVAPRARRSAASVCASRARTTASRHPHVRQAQASLRTASSHADNSLGLMRTWPMILRSRPSASQSSTVAIRHRCQGRRSSVANMGVHRDQFEQHRPRLRCPPNSAGWSTRRGGRRGY